MKQHLCLAIALTLSLFATHTQADENSLIMQSTTSTQNSGLLDYLLPKFKAEKGITVHVVAVGTGQALKNATNGDGDLLLVHAKAAEEAFVAAGNGVKRYDVMYNDFVIVGPAKDPAGIKGMQDVIVAFDAIAMQKALFASRGDNSGTHKKERSLWKQSQNDPAGQADNWYRETGSGMGATLNTAVGMGAYTMTDRATWIAFKNRGDYQVLVEGDKQLFNQYGVILVNPEKHPHVKQQAGQTFINWLISETGQQLINSYQLNGKQLFFANAK